jgi:Ulp1 family protease
MKGSYQSALREAIPKDAQHILLILVTVNHFVFCHLDVNERTINAYDSIMNHSIDEVQRLAISWASFCQDQTAWNVVHHKAPQQHNHNDCGVFSCVFLSLALQCLNLGFLPSRLLPEIVADFPKDRERATSQRLRLWLAGAIQEKGCVVVDFNNQRLSILKPKQ